MLDRVLKFSIDHRTLVVLLTVGAALVTAVQGLAPPFGLRPRLADPGVPAPAELLLGIAAFIWAASILGYLRAVARAEAAAAPPAQPRSRFAADEPPAEVA